MKLSKKKQKKAAAKPAKTAEDPAATQMQKKEAQKARAEKKRAELAGGAFRCVLGERSTAVCDPVLREGSCSTAWFSLQACARGQVAVGVVRAGYAQLDRWATETGDGWGYLAATGELVHAGRGRKWAGGPRSGPG